MSIVLKRNLKGWKGSIELKGQVVLRVQTLKNIEEELQYYKDKAEYLKQEKFKIIESIHSKKRNLLNVKAMCKIAEVSRSGYYNFPNKKGSFTNKELQDLENYKINLEAYNY